MTQTIALIGAGYTLQRFKHLYNDYNFHETHRESLHAKPDSIWGDLSFLEHCDALVFSLPPRPEALNLIQHLQFNKRAILLSSIGVYAKSDGTFDESCPVGESDRAQLIAAIENEFLTFDNAVVLRLGGLFDEGRHPINSIIRKQVQVQANERINFVHIDDVCEAIHCLLTSNPKHQFYNLVDTNHPIRKDYYSSLTREPLTYTTSSDLDYKVSSERFLKEFQTSAGFLDKVHV
jgi:hypothetical protein